MPAVCLTRPQYVLRSYCDSGSSRLPGIEADMLAWVLEAAFFSVFLVSSASGRSQWQGFLVLGNGRREERRRSGV